jgi:glutaredoxin
VKSRTWAALAVGLALAALSAAEPPPSPAPDIEFFTRAGCPHCARAREFLQALEKSRPELIVLELPVDSDPEAYERLLALAARHRVGTLGVPAFHLRGQLVVGFLDGETTGRQIRALLDAEPLVDSVETGAFGRLSARELGLPLFTLVIGLLDGFNPCAMWVLLFLLSMLVHLRSRRKMVLIAGTFVAVSGVAYFAFMAAWLNLFLLIGFSRAVQILLGLTALGIGSLHVKEFFAFRQGPSLAIPEAAKPGLYARVRAIVRADNMAGALGSVIVLAVLVNIVELLCTAGFPAVYTQILSSQELPQWQHYAYLGLYVGAYMADDTVMVAIAVWTLGHRKLGETGGRALQLSSGLVMLGLGAVLLFWPRFLS